MHNVCGGNTHRLRDGNGIPRPPSRFPLKSAHVSPSLAPSSEFGRTLRVLCHHPFLQFCRFVRVCYRDPAPSPSLLPSFPPMCGPTAICSISRIFPIIYVPALGPLSHALARTPFTTGATVRTSTTVVSATSGGVTDGAILEICSS